MGGKAVDKTFDLPAGWQAAILALYRDGACDEEVTAWIQDVRGYCTNYLFDCWKERVPEFAEVIEKGHTLQHSWWMKQGRTNISNNKFNTPLYTRLLFAICGVRAEPQAIEASHVNKIDLGNLPTEDLEALKKLMEKAAKEEAEAQQQYGDGINGVIPFRKDAAKLFA